MRFAFFPDQPSGAGCASRSTSAAQPPSYRRARARPLATACTRHGDALRATTHIAGRPVTGWPKPVPWWPSRGNHALTQRSARSGQDELPAGQPRKVGDRRRVRMGCAPSPVTSRDRGPGPLERGRQISQHAMMMGQARRMRSTCWRPASLAGLKCGLIRLSSRGSAKTHPSQSAHVTNGGELR